MHGCGGLQLAGPEITAVLPRQDSVSPLLTAREDWGGYSPRAVLLFSARGRKPRDTPVLGTFQEMRAHVTRLSLCPCAASGWILIDRCGKHFGTILNYLRDGAVPLPESRREIEELLAEAKYYLVQGLVEECQAALQVGIPLSPQKGGEVLGLPAFFIFLLCKMGAVPPSLRCVSSQVTLELLSPWVGDPIAASQ